MFLGGRNTFNPWRKEEMSVTCKMWRDGAPPSPTGAEAGNKTLLSLNGAG